MAKESLFLSFIRMTFKKWVGFQDGINEGMGGIYAKEKEEWLSTEVEKYFKSYNDVSPSDLEEYLGAMMDNEFDIQFEDGSLLATCELFCEAYNQSLIDPNAPMFQDLKKSEPASRTKQSCQREEIVTEKTVTSEMEQLSVHDPEEESWTVVTRKGHKK